MSDITTDSIERFEDRSCKEAEAILRHVMHRQRWSITVRDELALRLRMFATDRHLELTSERRKNR